MTEETKTDTPRFESILGFTQTLSNIDILMLMRILAPRLDVYVGQFGEKIICGGLSHESPACLNGPSVQLNMDLSDLEDLRDDPWISEAIAPEIEEEADNG